MMSGYMAFEHETDLEFTRKVSKNDWTMDLDLEEGDENPFDEISEEGKDFITRLIQPRPEKRLSAEECFEHPWFKDGFAQSFVPTIVPKYQISYQIF